MKYSENWDALNQILYEDGVPRKKIPKESLEEILQQTETLKEALVIAYFRNNQELMANLIETGAINFNFFASTLSPEKEIYFKLGELKGAINIMARIVSNIVNREQTLRRFNQIQESFPSAKDVILCIGGCDYSIQEKDLLEKMSHNYEKKELTDALYLLKLHSFIYSHSYGTFCDLFLSDSGRIVYHHYKEPKEEIYYHA